jgi:hypothetical protein
MRLYGIVLFLWEPKAEEGRYSSQALDTGTFIAGSDRCRGYDYRWSAGISWPGETSGSVRIPVDQPGDNRHCNNSKIKGKAPIL